MDKKYNTIEELERDFKNAYIDAMRKNQKLKRWVKKFCKKQGISMDDVTFFLINKYGYPELFFWGYDNEGKMRDILLEARVK